MRAKACHTSFPQGATVHVIMRDGTVYERAKFVEHRDRYVVLRDIGKLRTRDIRSMTYANIARCERQDHGS